jgi:hypothetical protein
MKNSVLSSLACSCFTYLYEGDEGEKNISLSKCILIVWPECLEIAVWIHCLDKMGKLGIVVVVLVVGAILVPNTRKHSTINFYFSVKKNDIFRMANKNFTTLWAMRQDIVCFLEHSHEGRPILFIYTLQPYIQV